MRIFILLLCTLSANAQLSVEVLVAGGGTGGTAAAIQSARLGAQTLIVSDNAWLGGMISAAGVSAIDGNHQLPSGLWAEFRQQLYKVYGGPQALETGWVSNTLFEPHVADSIFKQMAGREKFLSIRYNLIFTSLKRNGSKITEVIFTDTSTGKQLTVKAKVVIDATELGDLIKAAGIPYDLGMEAGTLTQENAGVTQTNEIIQDMTYAAVLKDYGPGSDHTITKPANYDPSEFDGCCTDYYHDTTRKKPVVDAKKMLGYGKLPNGKFMINWPVYGNDTYLDIVEMNAAQRQHELIKAKETTRRFVYFIQHQLGFKNLGLAGDEFPTSDSLAIIPYHREGRRLKGLVRYTMRNIGEPFTYGQPLYRTGIAVGDYPIDHHHKKNPVAPQHLEFYPIPSFNVPLGALIPQDEINLIVAEKGISVSNVVNGTTRLQPCVMLSGQAAGILASISATTGLNPRHVPVRRVQRLLLDAKAYLMPYIDVQPDHPFFQAVQRIGATGILKGQGIPYKWADQTWFYPDSVTHAREFKKGLNEFKQGNYLFADSLVTIAEAIHAISLAAQTKFLERGVEGKWQEWGLKNYDPARHIRRAELAVLLDRTLDPFTKKAIDHNGNFEN